jgi:hypothetical protein
LRFPFLDHLHDITDIPKAGFDASGHCRGHAVRCRKIVASEHDYALREKRVDASMRLRSPPANELPSADERRRNIEALAPTPVTR